jgi:hypothetical protein
MTATGNAPRSAFVTSLAWGFIVLAAITLLLALVQGLVFMVVTAGIDVEIVIRNAREAGLMPEALAVLFRSMRWILVSVLLLSVVTLVAGYGLLLRKRWARIAIIVMLWLGAVANLAGLWLQYRILDDAAMVEFLVTLVATAGLQADEIGQGAMISSAVIAIVFTWLFAWTAIRLASKEFSNEFN